MDERFKKALTDPRFTKAKKDSNKVVLDSRFAHMLHSEEFGSLGGVDKRGRLRDPSLANDLKNYYKIDDNDAESDDERPDFARGKGFLASSSDDEENIELPAGDDLLIDEGPWADEDIPTGEETNRFAAVNLDWDHVKAKHLFKVYDAFKPAKGKILSVRIYKSEFGKQRLEKEQLQGPEIAKPTLLDSDSDEDEFKGIEDDEGKDFNMIALRKYEIEKLKYYYAVVECDSVATASSIYKTCDGTEFESSANFFDLRFIPDEMEFNDDPVDEAFEAPVVYQPTDFITHALQHSNVKLTWDEQDPEWSKTTKKKFSKQDLKDMDFKAYLASESDDEVVLAANVDKYKALVAQKDNENSEGTDMEITFQPGLSEKAEQMLKKKQEEKERAGESVFEAERRRIREKKLAKKKAIQDFVEESSDDMAEREDLNDPFFQNAHGSDFEEQAPPPKLESRKSAKQERKEAKKQQHLSKQQLESLFDGEDDGNHFNAKDIIKSEKLAKTKSKKLKSKFKNSSFETQTTYKLDINDQRFNALIEDHEYSIDPNNSHFKNTDTMRKVLSKKREANTNNLKPIIQKTGDRKSELNTLIESVKRKAERNAPGRGKRMKEAVL